MKFDTPTIHELEVARKVFEAKEPRDLFYRAAIELVDLAIDGKTKLSKTEAIAVLLQTWNRAYYQHHPISREHFSDIDRLLASYEATTRGFMKRSIDTFAIEDEGTVKELFQDFEVVLAPVGTAKCLHLLAPRFFPLWDRAIAKAYKLALGERGKNGERYCNFMKITQEQCRHLGGEQVIGRNPLKALDEYNYCKFTKGWI